MTVQSNVITDVKSVYRFYSVSFGRQQQTKTSKLTPIILCVKYLIIKE